MAVRWPVELSAGAVRLRPLRRSDERAWRNLRGRNAAWLRPWESTSPEPDGRSTTFRRYVRALDAEGRSGAGLPFAVVHTGELVGQLTVSGIAMGSMRSASIGYWIGEHAAGLGIIPTAVALAGDYCFQRLGLHRLEINIRPENVRSLRVVGKLGFRDEGLRVAYMHIDGQWRDHRSFALTAPEVPEGLLARVAGRTGAGGSAGAGGAAAGGAAGGAAAGCPAAGAGGSDGGAGT